MSKTKHESAIALIFDEQRKKVLLVKRRDVPVWTLPGGKIEKDEPPQNSIIREVEEETGYLVKITKKIGEYYPINRLSFFTHLFECQIIQGEKKISKETKEISFFSINSLPIMPIPYKDWIIDGLSNHNFLIKKKLNQITYFSLIKNMILHPILVFRFLLSRMGFPINR
ncbi:MAG: hypothetical protein AMS24_02550 [Chlamydiae bacterium SM23_39]|nr:MAG: hypothetical protein AMS24_02550 [Chlamydiae bacterium SM23_39]